MEISELMDKLNELMDEENVVKVVVTARTTKGHLIDIELANNVPAGESEDTGDDDV